MSRIARRRTTLAIVILALVTSAEAARPTTHEVKPESMLDGRLDGIAVSSTGQLSAAPVLRRLSGDTDGTSAAHVWSIATASDGSIYLGTGPDGRILLVRSSGSVSVVARLPEPMVTALVSMPDGSIVAGTSPGGRIYRVSRDGTVEAWHETESRYVWDLCRTADGRMFVATGEPGAVLRIGSGPEPEAWFDAPDPHVVTLRELPGGDLLAGASGSGVLYRLDADGRPFVLHDDELPEIADVAVLSNGDVLAAAVAPPPVAAHRPGLRIRLPADPRFGESGTVDSLDDTRSTEIEGIIEGMDARAVDGDAAPRGKILRIRPSGHAVELWRSTDQAVFSIAVDAEGRSLFGTGEPARLYEIEGAAVTLLASLDEGQATGLVPLADTVVVATSNPASSFVIDWGHDEAGVFVSPVVDAGAPARWGSIRWWTGRFPSPIELFTRTGNSAQPDDSWSGWSAARPEPGGSRIENPDGRYLQWRVRIPAGRSVQDRVADVRITYEPYNRPPQIRASRVAGSGLAIPASAEWSWTVRDPDGDALSIRAEARRDPGSDWREVGKTELLEVSDDDLEAWRAGSTTLDLGTVEEGEWELRLRVDDARSNAPGAAEVVTSRERTFRIVDRTAPRASVTERSAEHLTVEAVDDESAILDAIVLVDDVASFRAEARDGVCDNAAETLSIRLPQDARGRKLGLRLVDAAGNSAVIDLTP